MASNSTRSSNSAGSASEASLALARRDHAASYPSTSNTTCSSQATSSSSMSTPSTESTSSALATPRDARKVQRYHRIASILIPIAPAVRIPNLSIGKQTLTRATDRWTLQKSPKHRQVHALAKTLGSTAHHNGRVAVQHIGNKHGLVNQHAATKGLRIVVHANGQNRIVGTADQAHAKASSTINICLFRHQNVPPKSLHDANCNDRLARTDDAVRTYRATVATRGVGGHN